MFDGTEKIIFASMREFLDYVLTDSYRSFTFYAHFAERFDFKFLIQELLLMEIETGLIAAVNNKRLQIKFIQAGERIREIYIKDGNRNYWRFADSSWLIPSSLAKAAKAYNVEHKKTSIDFDKISIDDPLSRAYCLNDCICLYEILTAYFNQKIFKGLKPKGTIASNAMSVFRSKMTEPIKGISRREEDFIRRAYFGGRVEIFKMHGSNLNYYDFNSLYPSTMVDSPFPVGLPAWVDTFVENLPGFYLASVDMPPEIYIPPLPIVKDGKLIFPCGTFTGYFASCELECAQALGAKIKVKKGIVFHQSKHIFKKYVADLYEMKSKADPEGADYLTAKLYLNGLYGKFGQRREQSAILRCSSDIALEKNLTPYMPEFGLWIEKSQSRGSYIMPNIAAWVTAKARLKLYSVLNKNSYYCDTDSVFTPDVMPCDPHRLGALKLEKTVREAYFLLPKLYHLETTTGTITKAKGYGRDFLTKINQATFAAGLTGDFSGFRAEVRRLLGIKESLRRFGKMPVSALCKKSIKTRYNKRQIVDDYDTKPWVLNGYSCQL